MIFWRTTDWQPAFKLWHDLFSDLCMNRKLARDMKMASKPRLAEGFHNNAMIRANIARDVLQVLLIAHADAPPEQMLPHVEVKDVEELADARLHERLPESADVEEYVLIALSGVMTRRHCKPEFPKLK